MTSGAPVVNFNGAILVGSLETGTVLVGEKSAPAVRILMRQTLNYPILVLGKLATEAQAYCACAHEKGVTRLEAYAPCYLARDLQSGGLVSVATRIAWYVPALAPCAEEAVAWQTVNGATPFAVFGEESYLLAV